MNFLAGALVTVIPAVCFDILVVPCRYSRVYLAGGREADIVIFNFIDWPAVHHDSDDSGMALCLAHDDLRIRPRPGELVPGYARVGSAIDRDLIVVLGDADPDGDGRVILTIALRACLCRLRQRHQQGQERPDRCNHFVGHARSSRSGPSESESGILSRIAATPAPTASAHCGESRPETFAVPLWVLPRALGDPCVTSRSAVETTRSIFGQF